MKFIVIGLLILPLLYLVSHSVTSIVIPKLGATVLQSTGGGTGTSTTPTDNSILLGHASDKTYNVKTSRR